MATKMTRPAVGGLYLDLIREFPLHPSVLKPILMTPSP